VWDGNEVWLIAAGGVLVFAFPHAYAVAFSGFYLPLMVVLWLLVVRGIAIEFRSQLHNALWRSAWDAAFALASIVMAVVLGVALANVIRGLPIDASGWFHLDLFDFTSTQRGAIDLFSIPFGVLVLVVFAAHGTTYLAWKTEGPVHDRSVIWARRAWIATIVLVVLVTILTFAVEHAFRDAVLDRPWLWPLPVLAIVAAVLARVWLGKGATLRAFLASGAFIVLLLVATAGALYPTILRSTVADAYTVDVQSGGSNRATLRLGLFMWVPAVALAIGYFAHLFRSFRGPVAADAYHE
jgi:cytochrome d ubiquinol oxidase subunit II